ncbi:hypothetical protein RCJ22_20950 [Vibrio sp. FNV 38]|nr:hypothetical protein [Vibrio sp. FNV 38]
MDRPKVFVITLVVLVLLLIVLLMLNQHTRETLTFPIVAQTATQSLDGDRRYLTLFDDKGQPFVVTIPASVDCSHASHARVTASKEFVTRPHFKFVSCQ